MSPEQTSGTDGGALGVPLISSLAFLGTYGRLHALYSSHLSHSAIFAPVSRSLTSHSLFAASPSVAADVGLAGFMRS